MKSKKQEWVFATRPREHVRWAFRLFIVSFLTFFVFSIFFYFTYFMQSEYTAPRIYSVLGRVPINVAVYIFLFTFVTWTIGWAIMWGSGKSKRPKSFVLASWAIPLSIIYFAISITLLYMLGVEESVMTTIVYTPPILTSILVPQIFVRGMLKGIETILSKIVIGIGVLTTLIWNFSSANANIYILVEILLPTYFAILTIEYLSIHLRINGPGF